MVLISEKSWAFLGPFPVAHFPSNCIFFPLLFLIEFIHESKKRIWSTVKRLKNEQKFQIAFLKPIVLKNCSICPTAHHPKSSFLHRKELFKHSTIKEIKTARYEEKCKSDENFKSCKYSKYLFPSSLSQFTNGSL